MPPCFPSPSHKALHLVSHPPGSSASCARSHGQKALARTHFTPGAQPRPLWYRGTLLQHIIQRILTLLSPRNPCALLLLALLSLFDQRQGLASRHVTDPASRNRRAGSACRPSRTAPDFSVTPIAHRAHLAGSLANRRVHCRHLWTRHTPPVALRQHRSHQRSLGVAPAWALDGRGEKWRLAQPTHNSGRLAPLAHVPQRR